MKRACFWCFLLNIVFRFNPTNKKHAFIELTNFKNFDSEVPNFYFGTMATIYSYTFPAKAPINLSML